MDRCGVSIGFYRILFIGVEYMELPQLIEQVLKELMSPGDVPGYSQSGTWASIEFPPGYEKPPKEAFDARLKELVDAQPLKELRQERDRRLQAVDWVAIRAFTTSTPVPQEWLDYMQALRDLPATTGDPKNPVWPTAPTS
jgi:hypothetical protein